MKKRFTALLLVICCAVFFTLTACGKNKEEGPDYGTQYSYRFETNGGSAVAGGTLYVNEYIPVPQTPTRDGYEFTGWYTDSACTKFIEFVHPPVRMPAHDIVYYAGWSQLISISFNANGGNLDFDKIEGHAGEIISQSVINALNNITKADSVFLGWYADSNFTEEFTFDIIPYSNATAYAKWREINGNVSVTFRDGYNTPKTFTGKEGDLLTDVLGGEAIDAPQDTEYMRFVGWATDEEGYGLIDENYRLPESDVTLYAITRRKQEWARIKVLDTDYTVAADFFAKKGYTVTDANSGCTYSGTIANETFINASALEADKLNYDSFIDSDGTLFDFEYDVVTGDMNISLNVFSEALSFAPIRDQNGAIQYLVVVGFDEENGEIPTSDDALVIPSTYYGFPVSIIYDNAFEGQKFSGIEMGDNIEIIRSSAFENCTNLTSVTFPKNLSEVLDSAFKGCMSLETVDINDNVYYLGYRVFENTPFETALIDESTSAVYVSDVNKNIKQDILYMYGGEFAPNSKITIGRNRLSSIAGGAFEGKDNLVSVTIAGDVYLVGEKAFYGCKDLTEVVLGSNVQIIRASAFEGCESLETVDQTNNEMLRMVGAAAFKDCTSLTSFSFGLRFTSLGEYAFSGCTSLKSVTSYLASEEKEEEDEDGEVETITIYTMSALSAIPAYAFENCTALTQIMLLDNVQTVGESAFAGCESLKYAFLGFTTSSKLTSVDANAFAGCQSLKSVIITKAVTSVAGCPTLAANTFDSSSTVKIFVFEALLNVYKNAYSGKSVNAYEGVAPTIKLTAEASVVEISSEYGYDVLELAKSMFSATDNVSAAQDLDFTIASVEFGSTELEATDSAGACYALTEVGQYTVTLRVSDECNNSATATFTIVVKANIL